MEGVSFKKISLIKFEGNNLYYFLRILIIDVVDFLYNV
jgi:hypothetical protein